MQSESDVPNAKPSIPGLSGLRGALTNFWEPGNDERSAIDQKSGPNEKQ